MEASPVLGISFPEHARAVARSLRAAFSEALASAGADPADPQAISRRLGLNKNLAWKLAKLIQAEDAPVALRYMPGSEGVRIFLRRLEEAGVGAQLVEAAREAIRQYDQLIEIHSGDRATLEMMGTQLSAAARREAEEHYRKLLFQGASYVWGVQARVVLKVGVVGPAAEDGYLDFASLSALIDFRRLRPDVSWVLAMRRSTNDNGTAMRTSAFEPIDSRYASDADPPLMADFCSQPLPQLRRVEGIGGASFELVEGPVGKTGAVTCVVGTVQRRVPYYRTPENEIGEHLAACDTPAELLIVDLYAHEHLSFAIPPEVHLYGRLGPSVPLAVRDRERNRLPLSEPLQDLGRGHVLPPTPEVRRYAQMVQAVFDRMGWRPGDFHGFRIRIAYPVFPSDLVLRYRLPERP